MPGLFIALEGPDGAGKSTQVRRLAERLRAAGRTVREVREPGGTALGERIRAILLDRAETGMAMRTELLLYMAARAQLVESVIRPALEAGETVVSDRYLVSSFVYQGEAGGLDVAQVQAVGELATGGLWPDLIVILDVPAEIGADRCGARRNRAGRWKGPQDRLEARGREYHEAVVRGFRRWAGLRPGIVLLDGTRPEDEVAEAVWSRVRALTEDRP